MTATAAEALRAGLAAFGPFFAIETHSAPAQAQSPWQPLSPVFSSAAALAARIDGVRSALADAANCPSGAIEYRVAASVAQLGLSARLIAPALGSAVLGKPLPIDITSAWWIPGLGGPFRLSLPASALTARPRQDSPAAGGACGPLLRLLDGPIRSLVELTASTGVSRRVLWGNVGSAVNGAAVMITAAAPGLASETAVVSSGVLRFPELAGSYRGRPVASFRRQSCCLIYRIARNAPPEFCGDCVLSGRA